MRNGIDYKAYFEMAQKLKAEAQQEHTEESEFANAGEFMADVEALKLMGYRRGEKTGWPSLDENFTVRKGELTVITGIGGHGKSTWLDNLMVNISNSAGWKWAVFSAENLPISRHIAGILEILMGKPFPDDIPGAMTLDEVRAGMGIMSKFFNFIRPKSDRYSVDRIVQIAFEQVSDIDALVIDPWNELDHSRPRELREDEFISLNLTKLRWLARHAEIHVFVVAHPGKYQRKQGEPKPVISLNEVKGASEWYAKADNGISVWRDETDQTGATDVHVLKVRFREVGRAGEARRLYYHRATNTFTDPQVSADEYRHLKQYRNEYEA